MRILQRGKTQAGEAVVAVSPLDAMDRNLPAWSAGRLTENLLLPSLSRLYIHDRDQALRDAKRGSVYWVAAGPDIELETSYHLGTTPGDAPLKDAKEALTSARKPDITHVRTSLLNYVSRNCEYGTDKYERANYLRPAGKHLRADFKRYRTYLRAVMSHTLQTLDAMELHEAGDPGLNDIEGMKRAAYAVDIDETPGAKVGASLLPHIGGAAASLNMAITQAVNAGLLPADPGTPWRK